MIGTFWPWSPLSLLSTGPLSRGNSAQVPAADPPRASAVWCSSVKSLFPIRLRMTLPFNRRGAHLDRFDRPRRSGISSRLQSRAVGVVRSGSLTHAAPPGPPHLACGWCRGSGDQDVSPPRSFAPLGPVGVPRLVSDRVSDLFWCPGVGWYLGTAHRLPLRRRPFSRAVLRVSLPAVTAVGTRPGSEAG